MSKNIKYLSSLFCLLILFCTSYGQTYSIKGTVLDSLTKESLPFANIRINDGQNGGITDIDGKFLLKSNTPILNLTFSYVGYKTIKLNAEQIRKDKNVLMSPSTTYLEGIIITPKENPANKIISKVVENRDKNNYENLPEFEYTTYERMFFAPENDSLPNIDSLKFDTTYQKMRSILNSQYLFLMESVNKRLYKYPQKNQYQVVASKVSGLKNPFFILSLQQMLATSFYKEPVTILGVDYINPISKSTFKRYYFEIQDTIVEPPPYDTTFIISFRPLLNSNFNSLKGLLSISSNNYAIRSIIAKASNIDSTYHAEIQQLNQIIDSNVWFPSQLNTEITFNTVELMVHNKERFKIKAVGKSYINDINLKPNLQNSDFGIVEMEIKQDYKTLCDSTWEEYRNIPLNAKEKKTYRVIDSIGEEANLDRYLSVMVHLINGTIPIKYFQLHLFDLVGYNKYEGWRLGAHISTTSRLSKRFSLGGYVAYGFKDKVTKYGGNIDFNIIPRYRTKISLQYKNDLYEAGIISDMFDISGFWGNYRNYMLDRMDKYTMYRVKTESMITRKVSAFVDLKHTIKSPLYDYSYIVGKNQNVQASVNLFKFSEATIGTIFRFGKNSAVSNSIVKTDDANSVCLAYTFGKNLFAKRTNYHRIELMALARKKHKLLAVTDFTVKSGYIIGKTPYVNLYNADASYSNYFLFSDNSFNTMRYNEFTSTRFISFFISHNTNKSLLKSKLIRPTPSFHFNFGYGYASPDSNHKGIEINSYEKGFYEVGLRLNKVLCSSLSAVGIGAYYRLGHYAFDSFKDNISINFTLNLF
ncbi:MAG: DUF5686 family protein [Bacteroidales bacterium]